MSEVLTLTPSSPPSALAPSSLPKELAPSLQQEASTQTEAARHEDQLLILQQQVQAALHNVDEARVRVNIGRADVRQDQAVILSWSKHQSRLLLDGSGSGTCADGDGVLFYLAIRFNRESDENNNASANSTSESTDEGFTEGDTCTWLDRATLQRRVEPETAKGLFIEERFAARENVPEHLLQELFLTGAHQDADHADRNSKRRKSVHWPEQLVKETEVVDVGAKLRRCHSEERRRPDFKHPSLPAQSRSPTHLLRRSRSLEHGRGRRCPSVVGVLSSDPPVVRAVRRLRALHVPTSPDIWFGGASPGTKSFNVRCSASTAGRYDLRKLKEDSKHYYFYQTRPKTNRAEEAAQRRKRMN